MSRDEFGKGVRESPAHRAGFRYSKPDCPAATAGPSDDDGKHPSDQQEAATNTVSKHAELLSEFGTSALP